MNTYQIRYRDGVVREVRGTAIHWLEHFIKIVSETGKTAALVALDLVWEILVIEDDDGER